jgi:3-isopropylmalate/(R)-2-methylmalate dehydratase small subunit
MIIRGNAWILGDDISTDHIISGKYRFESLSLEDMLPHVFEGVIPSFYRSVKKGDIIVAGKNFGIGSSREHAPLLLKMIGISAIIAKSFGRIFYRNCINIGLPVLTAHLIPDVTANGDLIEIDFTQSTVINLSRKIEERFTPFPKEILDIILNGGIIEYIKKKGALPW